MSRTGGFFPAELIYQAITPHCLPKNVNFPIDFDVKFTTKHWSNQEKAKQLFEKLIFTYLKKKKRDFAS